MPHGEKQRRLFGLVRGLQKGTTKKGSVKAKKLARTTPVSDVKKLAGKVKHKRS